MAKWGRERSGAFTSAAAVPSPFLDIFSYGSSDSVDYNLAMVFHKPAELPGDESPSTEFGSDESFRNYLRIQTDSLDINALDNASEQNMRKLVAEAEKLLTKRATTRNLDTGKLAGTAPMGARTLKASGGLQSGCQMRDRGSGMPKVRS